MQEQKLGDLLNGRPFQTALTKRKGVKEANTANGISVRWQDGSRSNIHPYVKVTELEIQTWP